MIKTPPLHFARLNALSQEIGAWAGRNFKTHAPILGLFEEIGELAHCVLKRKQKIRKFDQPAHFAENAEDALADIAIYALHGVHLAGIELIFLSVPANSLNETRMLADLSQAAVDLAYENPDARRAYVRLLTRANELAAANDINLMEVIEKTWARVSKRDWVTNPDDADKKALAQGGEKPQGEQEPAGGVKTAPLINEGAGEDTSAQDAVDRKEETDRRNEKNAVMDIPEKPAGEGDKKSGETTVDKSALPENSKEFAETDAEPKGGVTGNGPANAAPVPDPTLAKALPETGENPSGKKGDGDTHPEPSTVNVKPSEIHWSKAIPKEPGDFFFHHKNSPAYKDAPVQSIKILDVQGELRVTSAEIQLDDKPLDIALADLKSEFTTMKFARKDLPTAQP